ncbi:hypothetical protein SAMN05216464_101299 [Mucilaginibacter pineti]|uniref:Uncharacterized protein n=1 Tax=Mucilaginibacter pineti TaxID=1391627 RepID=A0A1G6THZ6_9SPHI|nr:hypothetical protein [Mucilaginibacter pineti]SDD28484.1 hypothetical protein SAMN05216464_101299 [Mucilaginibacter pineti]
MKKLYLLSIFFAMFCFSSCVDIEEHYDFKSDGSCKVVYGFDMSKAVSVLVNLMSDSVKETPQFSLVKDTTLNFYSAMPDSIQRKMNLAETNLAKSSELTINMNLKKSIMKVSLDHNAKNAADLQYYLQNVSKIALNSQITAFSTGDKAAKALDARQMVAGQDYYSYNITPHKFYRIIDKVKFRAFLKKTQSTFMMAKAMLIDMPYKVILKFAKPVKKLDNSKAILSADRRSVTLVTNMDEVIKNPSVMNLKIDF